MAKIPPMELQIRLPITAAAPSGYVDIAQCLSLMNRKFLRQGQQFVVESWTLSGPQAAQAFISVLSNTWVNANAWVMAFNTWLDSQDQVVNADSIRGRYHDFKVFMDTAHQLAGVPGNLLPVGFDPALVTAVSATAGAQWDPSQIVIPNDGGVGVVGDYELHMAGPDVGGSKGIIEGYANNRRRPSLVTENLVDGTSWMTKAFDSGDNFNEISSDLQDKNDSPPYFLDEDTIFEFYPGGANRLNGAGDGMVYTPELNLNPAVDSLSVKYGGPILAPCGLLYIAGTVPAGTAYVTLHIGVGPSTSKGVMSRQMQDVN